MRFKLSTKPSRRAATRVLVVQVEAVATQGSSYTLSSSMHCPPLPVLSLPPSLVCKHVFEAGHKTFAEKPSTWLSPVFPVSVLTSRMLGEDECLPQFLSLPVFPKKTFTPPFCEVLWAPAGASVCWQCRYRVPCEPGGSGSSVRIGK